IHVPGANGVYAVAQAPQPMYGGYGDTYGGGMGMGMGMGGSAPQSFGDALNEAGMLMAQNPAIDVVVAQVGADVAVFFDSNADEMVDTAVILAGARLSDITGLTFN